MVDYTSVSPRYVYQKPQAANPQDVSVTCRVIIVQGDKNEILDAFQIALSGPRGTFVGVQECVTDASDAVLAFPACCLAMNAFCTEGTFFKFVLVF